MNEISFLEMNQLVVAFAFAQKFHELNHTTILDSRNQTQLLG